MNRLSCFLSNLLFPIFTFSQIINIPNDQPTIQAGINAAFDGDTVLVADGTYIERINFRGKAITVASWFIIDGNKTHIENTIINSSWAVVPDSGSTVTFNSGEDTTSVLCGFTITGGTGTIDPYGFGSFGGGGISISSAGAKIQWNKITGNTITSTYAVGGGILISSNSNPVLVLKNEISDNKLIETGSDSKGGGGIFCYKASSNLILIAENIISDNIVISKTRGTLTGSGGGINLDNSTAFIRNNLIKNNKAENGGGLKINDPNTSDTPTIINNTIVYNEASLAGGGILGNQAIINSILWGNTAINNPQIYGNVSVNYSNVEGGFNGTGNIDDDPLFADTINYYLSNSSPCVDAGNPEDVFNDTEDPNNSGFALFPALGVLRNDMGYCGGDPNVDIETDFTLENDSLPVSFVLNQNYPNPFNPSTVIKYQIPNNKSQINSNSQSSNRVMLKVYDILGREVATLVNEQQHPGTYKVIFYGSELSSGIYLYKLTVGNYSNSKKMLLFR